MEWKSKAIFFLDFLWNALDHQRPQASLHERLAAHSRLNSDGLVAVCVYAEDAVIIRQSIVRLLYIQL